MKFINVGFYHCDFCKKDIQVRLYTDDPDHAADYKNECIKVAKNYHWYDVHYNCAVCGKWIERGERELVIEKDFSREIHPDYINEGHGLLRVHKKCMEGGEN